MILSPHSINWSNSQSLNWTKKPINPYAINKSYMGQHYRFRGIIAIFFRISFLAIPSPSETTCIPLPPLVTELLLRYTPPHNLYFHGGMK